MSLATNAALFPSSIVNQNINSKSQPTIKSSRIHKSTGGRNEKVNSVLRELYEDSDDETDVIEISPKGNNTRKKYMEDFNPPPYAVPTTDLKKTVVKGFEQNNINEELSQTQSGQPVFDNEVQHNNFMSNYMNKLSTIIKEPTHDYMHQPQPPHSQQTIEQYPQQIIEQHPLQQQQVQPYQQPHGNNSIPNMSYNQAELMYKLDKILHLLEENKNMKTSNINEEIILYSFLGIFMIFIADAFVRIGKYVR
jgi:hypothetical protein